MYYNNDKAAPIHWSDYLPLRDDIDRQTAPINQDYLLVFGNSGTKLSSEPVNTGYCDFESRRCWVNAEVANVEADPDRPWVQPYEAGEAEQIVATTYVAAHERAHARWTQVDPEDFEVKTTDGFSNPTKRITSKNGQRPGGQHQGGQRLTKEEMSALMYQRLLHTTWNILEDERIERLIERDFRYLKGHLRGGARSFLRRVPQPEDFQFQGVFKGVPVPQDPDDPNLVLSWVLRRRVLRRAGERETCPLSPGNQQKLAEIEPLLKKAFRAKNAKEVVQLAREIIEKLQIQEYNESVMKAIEQAISRMGGQRGQNDQAKGRSKGQSCETGTVQRGGQSGEPGDPSDEDGEGDGDRGDRDDQDDREGEGSGGHDDDGADAKGETGDEADSGNAAERDAANEAASKMNSTGYSDAKGRMKRRAHTYRAAPYDKLLTSVRSLLNSVSTLFRQERVNPGETFDRSGSRLSVRRAMRNDPEPFRVPTPPARRGKIAVRLIIDESGSMGGNKEWEAKRVAMVFYEALRGQHSIGVVVAPTGQVIADNGDGEIGKGFIAGYDSAQGTCFHEVLARELALLNADHVSTVKYAILIADGESGHHDGEKCREAVLRYAKRGIRCLGVGVGLTSGGDDFFRNIFGDFYISIRKAEEMPPQMSRILRTIARKAQRQHIY